MTVPGAVAQATLVALLLSTSPASAQAVRADRASLHDLAGVEVVVEDLIPEAPLDGLTKDQLLEAARDRLRAAGFPLTADTGGGAYLYINVNMTTGSGIYIYCVDVELRQAVRLERAPDRAVPEAVTWQTGVVGAVAATELRTGITSVVVDQLDTFTREFAEENPGTVTVP
ncbi:MAG: hypothetical protein CL471_18830 [Acidobacteria bacterium]|nr:hypothetical protein [Acidobacteriota bacterium]